MKLVLALAFSRRPSTVDMPVCILAAVMAGPILPKYLPTVGT